ncbi:MAG: hypothetical protein KTR16_15995 [Acidiferrobacterales bacterium]|nr:hypothetical protein [Acidiferrobacterales bacterium]
MLSVAKGEKHTEQRNYAGRAVQGQDYALDDHTPVSIEACIVGQQAKSRSEVSLPKEWHTLLSLPVQQDDW